MPNGCGLFALNYIDNLQNELNKLNDKKTADLTSTIKTVLQNTGKIFLDQTDEDQAVFNHDFRKKLIMDTLFRFVESDLIFKEREFFDIGLSLTLRDSLGDSC
ncbi:hypothetical protein QSH14_00030 [Proteus faecis]|uniref:Uncharacterized protein n=1 Tax=Proteus faecis TaxID=2050967 RepID=A0AAW7CIC3_9GAMM|nr:hypothetical protein [Proteus faecis]MDO5404717.1 hypothetical protein [Proteus sp. (in: enterobacteria)]MDL5165478.1 hypothetical protein [Proteus faecis]MDL5274258.1 hypothetical protein [Proteus faecis]MDL5277828.1 hypothetical protein [Proteus faecis]MDL5306818.1 hypothetical protein [Proteus faecis]